ncbi:Protein of unknown function [Pyronema omphalodes CBS 100304]|uniref:Uncharacterized protein n=1 Tax=Pyronema omphalodes (strain CBS 100304) TaxID=1076935 RepID=U4LBV1_PYROM|nr:Protein of unknown function [Pyronema omphalodes CBS 100304]
MSTSSPVKEDAVDNESDHRLVYVEEDGQDHLFSVPRIAKNEFKNYEQYIAASCVSFVSTQTHHAFGGDHSFISFRRMAQMGTNSCLCLGFDIYDGLSTRSTNTTSVSLRFR